MALILGMHVTGDQASASLVSDGVVVAGAAEERFIREKRSRSFPINAIKFCLRSVGLADLRGLDAIAMSWNPMNNARRMNMSGFTQWRRYDPEWLYILPNNLASHFGTDLDEDATVLDTGGSDMPPIYFVDHHLSHIGISAFQSPFNEGAVLIVDEYGEIHATTFAHFQDTEITVHKRVPFPHSLGSFFSAFTEFLGFMPNSDEWKVMGAAAFGDPDPYYASVRKLFCEKRGLNNWVLDLAYLEHANMKVAGYTGENLEKLLGLQKRARDDEMEQCHFDLAASVQKVFEDVLLEMVDDASRLTPSRNLVVGGGCFMNSLANGKMVTNGPFENVFIPVAPADNGCAIGAALWVYFKKFHQAGERMRDSAPSPFIGPSWSSSELEQTLQKCNISYTRLSDPASETANIIADGLIVGWFQGAMEFGERALGNRSILGDPRNADMKDRINVAVKYRESFRPFAPSVLEERAEQFFEMPRGVRAPYMEQVFPVRPEQRSVIPAVTHQDGTARVHTVNRRYNAIFYDLIQKFDELTGVPVVLNTSFNVQGEPIVCSPTDAVRTFYACGLDALVLGEFLVRK